MISPSPAPMGVYDGTQRIGEIIDHGPGCVIASGPDGKPIGRYPTRKEAMRAVSNAYRQRKAAARGLTPPDPPEAA